jgi:predicted flap endonuclease-1-like 5' DNA nuclease
MLYLVGQMTVFLVFSAAIGCGLGWWLRGMRAGSGSGTEGSHEGSALERARAAARTIRGELAEASDRLQRAEQELVDREAEVAELRERLAAAERREPAVVTLRPAKLSIAVDEAPTVSDAYPLPAAPVTAAAREDLTAIRGIGTATAVVLRELGYTSVEHIAAWGPADVSRVVAAKSALKGRIERDRWVEQAQAIVGGR